ncbi:MAG: acyltransferase family protein [Xanthobacteraceae bacterium]
MIAKDYRPDIDGLRGIAVTLVILFHAGLFIPGGFIGVDIFFVISGYLITSILSKDRLSIAEFYRNRARRILPALVAVYAACLVVGYLVLTPIDLRELGASILYSALFASNFYFYSKSGYFDGPAHEKPLLHTWSLSVEEQFYIAWPFLVLFVLSRFRIRTQAVVIVALALASVSFAQWQVAANPDAAFYWPTGRAWELLAGALLAIVPISIKGRLLREAISLSGLVAILASAFLLNDKSHVPGLVVMPAVVGSGAIIIANESLVSRLLALPIVRFTGLVSYSLYLWHWPILAFSRYYAERDLTYLELLAALFVLLPVAILSWRFIEQPFRRLKARPLYTLAVACSTLTIAGVIGYSASRAAHDAGYSPRALKAMHDAGLRMPWEAKCHPTGAEPSLLNLSDDCRIGVAKSDVPDFILIGDSHADHFAPAIDKAARETGLMGLQVSHGGCLPIFGITQVVNNQPTEACTSYRKQVEQFISTLQPGRLIIVAAQWSLYRETKLERADVPIFVIQNDNDERSEKRTQLRIDDGLKRTVESLVKLGHHVLLIGQVPDYPSVRLKCFLRYADRPNAGSLCGESIANIEHVLRSDSVLKSIADSTHDVNFMDPKKLICRDDRCSVEVDGSFLYRDKHHLNQIGSLALSPIFLPPLRRYREFRSPSEG